MGSQQSWTIPKLNAEVSLSSCFTAPQDDDDDDDETSAKIIHAKLF